MFSRPDCSFLEFHNQIYDSTHGEDSARDAGSGLLSAMHHRNGNPGIGAAHRSHSDRGYSGLDERALMPHTTLPSAPGTRGSHVDLWIIPTSVCHCMSMTGHKRRQAPDQAVCIRACMPQPKDCSCAICSRCRRLPNVGTHADVARSAGTACSHFRFLGLLWAGFAPPVHATPWCLHSCSALRWTGLV